MENSYILYILATIIYIFSCLTYKKLLAYKDTRMIFFFWYVLFLLLVIGGYVTIASFISKFESLQTEIDELKNTNQS